MTSVGLRVTKKNKNISVSMVNARSSREDKTKDGAEKGNKRNPPSRLT